MERKRSKAAKNDRRKDPDLSPLKITSVMNAKAGLEKTFKITDFSSLLRHLDACFYELESEDGILNDACQHVNKHCKSYGLSKMLDPSRTEVEGAQNRFIPIVCTHITLRVLLGYAQQLKDSLNGGELFPQKSPADTTPDAQREAAIQSIRKQMGETDIRLLLRVIDDWVHMLIPGKHYKKAMDYFIRAYDAHPAPVVRPKSRQMLRALFIVNTLYSVRLFTEACWKALIPAGKGNS